jgi:hypothetical protein
MGHCSAAPGVTVITVQQQLVLEPGCAKGKSMAVQVPKAVARGCCRGAFVIIIKGEAYPASGNVAQYNVMAHLFTGQCCIISIPTQFKATQLVVAMAVWATQRSDPDFRLQPIDSTSQ